MTDNDVMEKMKVNDDWFVANAEQVRGNAPDGARFIVVDEKKAFYFPTYADAIQFFEVREGSVVHDVVEVPLVIGTAWLVK